MLRFGGLKYKKLNNAGYAGEEQETPPCGPTEGNGKLEKSVHSTPTATTPSKQQQRLHNQLNGTAMKNVNTSSSEQKRHRNNFMLIVGGLSGKSHPEPDSPKSPSHAAVQPSSPSSNFKLLSGKFAIDSKRKINCKTRIYKCIKRILKRNSFHAGTPKEHQPRGQRTPAALRSPNAADYREIKSLLEKQHRDLEYDVNLAKCVEKPAFIKKIAINMLQSAVSDEKEDSTLVLHREQTASVTGTIQSDLERDREYQRLLDECWYHENLPRSLSLQLLMDKVPGCFLVRKSTTQPDCYALSLRVPPGSGPRIAHYLIVRTATDGYKIKGFQKEFSSLRALIVHHSVMPEALPVPLAVPRPVNLVVKTKFEDDYETVFDLAKAVQP
ncbi:EGFR adapter protein-like [Anopheles marshallii]|uniref:EGFR adapter protein-like n=1 Tax=Anopheles marshallii TaxID=1521116 RepID=UPI00237A59CC|nr:EGFR adapter protein-like [Anopheles marshallii]